MMKTIQLALDVATLEELDKVTEEMGTTRTAYLRNLVRQALRQRRIKELERQHAEAYTRRPVQPGEFDIPEEDLAWGEEWPWEDA